MRILIATATAGGGHLQAAAALDEAWSAYRPNDTLLRVDVLDFTPKLYRKAYAEGYVKLAEKAPELYAHAFRHTDNPAYIRKMTAMRRFTARWVTRKFIRALNEFRPDAILCPHFLPLETMGALNEKGLKIPRPYTVCVVTDFEAHALWMEPCVDLYCVAMDGTKGRLVARGIAGQQVLVTGIPVSTRFLKRPAKTALQKQYQLDPKAPTLLVLGGGMGMGPLVETLTELDRAKSKFQVIVVAGRNEALKKKLDAIRFQHPTRIFGFVSTMHELMAVSDLIVTKPGGLTTSESLAFGKPLLIVNPLPGQEAANSDFLLEHGAAIKANRLEDLPFRLDDLFKSKTLPTLAKHAAALGRPDAAQKICQAVYERLSSRA